MSHQASSKGSTVSFHDISYEVSVRKFPWSCPTQLSVLSNLSGIMTPGMNAIMGPTGCGKSSLLDVLAGRKNPQQVSGYVLLDGERRRGNIHRHLCGYVVQDNIAVDTLTVRENIAFSAALRLPRKLSKEERKAKVDEVIEELGLTSVADRLLGTAYVRGVSGGERKRTCIGIELVKNPLVLYLDEPTTGLDAYTAGSVMKTLKRLADCGRTIVFSIHQPKYSIYRLFDRLTLLSNGQVVYHGPSGQVPIEYFHGLGYVIEGYNNPADFLMDTLHGEVAVSSSDEDTKESPRTALEINELTPGDLSAHFVASWLHSELYRNQLSDSNLNEDTGVSETTRVQPTFSRGSKANSSTAQRIKTQPLEKFSSSEERGHIDILLEPQHPTHSTDGEEELRIPGLTSYRRHRRYKRFRCAPGCGTSQATLDSTHRFQESLYSASYCQQLHLLIQRQCLSMVRDYHTMFSHFLIQFVIALFLGTIYYDLDKSAESGIQNRTGLFFFTCLQLLFVNGSLVDAFLRDRVIFRHETSSGFYRISTYFFAKIITEVLPVKALPALLFLPITYILAGLRHSWTAFFFWELTVTLLTITASGIAFSVSTMVTDVRIGSMLLSMFFVLLMITGGFLINVLSLGPWVSWLRYLSVLRLAMNVLMINELVGVEFCPSNDTLLPALSPSETTGSSYSQLNFSSTEPLNNVSSMIHNITVSPTVLPCILGEQYLETQAIEYGGALSIWLNEVGIVGVFILALLNGYMYLRLMKKYT